MHSTASSPNAASSSAGTTTATPSRRPQRPCYRQRKPRRSRPTTSATPASPSGQKPATSPAPPSWQDTAASAQPTATPTAAAAPRRAYSPQLGKQTGETNWGSLATGETPLPHQIQKPRRKPSAKERTRTSTGVTPLPPQGSASAIPPPSQMTQLRKNKNGTEAGKLGGRAELSSVRSFRPRSPTRRGRPQPNLNRT